MPSPEGEPRPSADEKSYSVETEAMLRQAEALERLAVVSDPEYKPKRRAMQKFAALIVGGCSLILGGYEFGLMILDSHQRRSMVTNWVEAAREMYEVEGSTEEAQQMLARASEVSLQDVNVIKLGAYIEGMGVVERLVNLDRPFDKSDVEAFGKAMGQAVMLERVDGGNPQWAILRGQLAVAANEPERARVFLEKALQLDKSSAFATLRLALVYLKLSATAPDEAEKAKNLSEARRLVDASLAINPKFKWGHLWKGTIALEVDHDPSSALKHFRDATVIDPRFANAWGSMGASLAAAHDWPGAERAYLRALELRPDLTSSLIGLAFIYGEQDEYEIGLRYARRATEANAGSLGAWNLRGALAAELALEVTEADQAAKDAYITEAIDAYSKALDLDPREADAYIERAQINLQTGRLREAGEDARNATMLAPDDPYAWNALGLFQLKAGFPDKAVETFAKVVELEPKFDTAFLDRARALAALGDRAGAIADCDRGLAVTTEDFRADILLERGKLRQAQGQTELALADFVAARSAEAEMFEAWLAEARVLCALGRADAARAAAREALQLRPDDEAAKALVSGGC